MCAKVTPVWALVTAMLCPSPVITPVHTGVDRQVVASQAGMLNVSVEVLSPAVIVAGEMLNVLAVAKSGAATTVVLAVCVIVPKVPGVVAELIAVSV